MDSKNDSIVSRLRYLRGSKIQLPSDHKLRKLFGTSGCNDSAVTAQSSALYDVLNEIVIDARIYFMSKGERELAKKHLDFLSTMRSSANDLIIFDRGYPAFKLFEYCISYKFILLMRLSRIFNTYIDKISLGCHNFILTQGIKSIKVRIIKFKLPKGEIKTLVTNLFDYSLGQKAFKQLYFRRWPIETLYGKVKHQLEIENFSSRTEESIYQDYYITIFVHNLISIASKKSQCIC
ncbi:MAG: transposase, partial [Deltaproteobacteria bacterium]|nr:transposase [Deltaproteobacteria bacterium]